MTRSLFATKLYEADIGDDALLARAGPLDPDARRG